MQVICLFVVGPEPKSPVMGCPFVGIWPLAQEARGGNTILPGLTNLRQTWDMGGKQTFLIPQASSIRTPQ